MYFIVPFVAQDVCLETIPAAAAVAAAICVAYIFRGCCFLSVLRVLAACFETTFAAAAIFAEDVSCCCCSFFACAFLPSQVKIQQDTASPTLWGDACCVMLSGTMDNVVKAQQMILERIANISDRLKDMVSDDVFPCGSFSFTSC